MDTDLFYVVGLVIAVFSIPPIIGAISDGRAPRAAAIMVLIGGGLIALAVNDRPAAYTLKTTPDVFIRVVARVIN